MISRTRILVIALLQSWSLPVASPGIFLAGEGGGTIGFLTPDREVPAGSKVR